jgi:hypothetical protein
MQPEGSVLCLQETTTSSYPDLTESNPYPHTMSLKIHFNYPLIYAQVLYVVPSL